MFKKLLLISSIALISFNVNGQTYSIETEDGNTIPTCSGTFNDGTGQYSNNSDYTVTFCSGSTALINVNFSTLNVESGWDFLEVYDGPSTASPLLDNITGNVAPYIVQSSGSCITFHFTSDGSGTAAGWSGAITCVTPCSPPSAGGAVTNYPSPVKVCVNDVINFSGASSTAAAGFNIASYDWDFDDGSTGSGVSPSHSYSTPGEYIVQVEVTDNNSCTNNNLIDLVVQVGTEPTFVGTTPNQTVCVGENVCLTGVINATPWQDIPSTEVAGTTPLPDGSGVCYNAPLTFTSFPPGQTITNASQVLDVFGNIEHSWAGDLSIHLECPNGQQVGLFNADQTWNTTNVSSENFGDGISVGFDYEWVNAGSTMDDWGAANPGATTGTSIPAGTYASEEPFSNLVGCPLNGTWSLLVCDWFSSDDGTVFSWGMDFDPSLYAGISGFTPTYPTNSTGTTWSGNNGASTGMITSVSGDGNQVCVTPTATGTYSYNFTGTDEYGCTYDTTITVTATPGAIADANNDIAYCSGASGTIGVAPVAGVTYSWTPTTGLSSSTASNPTVTLTNATGAPITTTYVLTASSGSCSTTDTVNVTVNPQPVAGFTQPTAQCLTGNSFNFNNTGTTGATYAWDFGDSGSSTAENPSHTYASAGTYTVTQTVSFGTCVDTETLNVVVNPMPVPTASSDSVNCNGATDGSATVTGVTGTSAFPGGYGYSWAPGGQTTQTATGLAGSAGGTTYTVTVTDLTTTCTGQVSVDVFEPTPLTATEGHNDPTCAQGVNGDATANPSGGVGPYSYSWNTVPVQTTQTATGLAAGSYTCTITDANSCTTTTIAVLTDPAGMVLSTSMNQANCGAPDGDATVVVVSGGSGNFGYSWSTVPVQTTATASGIPSGTYYVTVNDLTAGCTSMDTIIVTTTVGITANTALINDALCNGASNGAAYAFPTGGTPAYTYLWDDATASTNDTLFAAAGTYNVTITDGSFCSGNATIVIGEPTPVIASITASTDETCLGANNGTATAGGTQGTGGYTYSWNTTPVQTTQTATGLAPGTYTAYVYDDNLCVDSVQVTINPGPLMTVSHTSVDVACFGGTTGSIDVTVNGAPGAITYAWTPGGSASEDPVGLAAGTYYLTASSGGCSINDTVTISEPTQLIAAIDSSFDVSCFGASDGNAYGSASGGVSPYSYLWDAAAGNQATAIASSLPVGLYNLTVTDSNNCTATIPVNIGEPAPLDAVLGSFDAYCGLDQGTVWAQPTNGTAPYIFVWDSLANIVGNTDTISGLFPGNYTLNLTDANNCKFTGSTTVIAAPGGVASISAQTDVNCFGDANATATVSVGGAYAPFTYQWDAAAGNQTSNPATGLAVGIYNVDVTDSLGCVMSTSADIKGPTLLTLGFTVLEKICYNSCDAEATAVPNGGVIPYTYIWQDPSSQITQTATGLCPGFVTLTLQDNRGCTVTDSILINNPPQMQLASVPVSASCNQADGGATVSVVANGTAPFTYEWSTDGVTVIDTNATLTNVMAGTYYATVFDSLGCSVIDTVVIPNASGPVIDSLNSTNVLCFGQNNGYAEVFVSGGATPYTYLWNDALAQTTPAASNLIAGTYNVTITDTNGCTLNGIANISEPNQLILTSGGVDPICTGYSDGSVWVNANGGTMPYSYLWNTVPAQANDTAYNLPAIAGGYTVTVTDTNNCQEVANVVITDPALFTINLSGVDVSCFGGSNGSASVSTNNGIAPFTYLWNDPLNQAASSATGLIANNYSVTVTDSNGCFANGSIIINEPTELVITEDSVGNVTCNGLSDGFVLVDVLGGSGAYSFNWVLGGTTISTVQNPTGLAAGLYSVTVTDTAGCSDQINVNITEPDLLVASVITSDAKCFNQNSGFAYGTVNGGTMPYNYQWNDLALQQTDTAFNLSAGSYNLTVTDSLGCVVNVIDNVINEPNEITLTPSAISSTCGLANGTASVAVGGGVIPFNFIWNDPSTQGNAVATGLFAGAYQVIVTDGNGCQDSAIANVIDFGSPVVVIDSITNVSCNGAGDGKAFASVSGGVAPYQYAWTNGDTTINATNLQAQSYTIQVTDSNGCIASADTVISQNAGVVVIANLTQNVSCNGGNDGIVFANGNGGTGAATLSYSWNTIPAQLNDTAVNLVAGTYVVTATDLNNCIATDTVIVSEPQLLVSSLDSLKDLTCYQSNDGYINVIATGGTLPYSWTSNITGGPTLSGLAAGDYYLIVEDAKGCIDSTYYTVTEPNELVITTDSVPSTCGQFNGSAEVTSVTGGTTPYTYNWNDPTNQLTALASGLAENTYTVTVIDNSGCTVVRDVTVEDVPGPIVDSVLVTDVDCHGNPTGDAEIFVSGNGPYTYSWTPSGQTTAQASNLVAGIYTVVVTDANLCSVNQGGIIVNEPTPLTANITMPGYACYGQEIQLFGVGAGGTAPYDILWGAPFGITTTGPLYDTVLTTTTYSIAVQDDNNCAILVSETINVGAPLSINGFGDEICLGDTANISAIAGGGNVGAVYEYIWMQYDSLSGVSITPAGVVNPTSSSNVNVYTVAETDYIVTVNDGCSRPASAGLTVNVNDTAIVSITSSVPGCPIPDYWAYGFEVQNDVWNSTFAWNFGDGGTLISANDSVSHLYFNSGTYDVQLTVTTENGCKSSFTYLDEAIVYQVPTADFARDPNVVTMLNPMYEFSDLSSIDVIEWNWDFGDLTTDLINQNPIHTYQDTGFYPVTLIVTNGFCEDTIVKAVQVKPDFMFVIPNTFTPGGDNLNEIFMPGTMIGVSDKDYDFFVFDRWGEVIYEGHDLDDGWDGYFKGEICKTDTYVWKIKLRGIDGVQRDYVGHVNLLR
jgi:gliding motility-associated-like protein